MNLSLSRDINGNKILRVRFPDGVRGFSVQTNGNLPRTHSSHEAGFEAENELNAYIKIHGTPRQKELLGWH